MYIKLYTLLHSHHSQKKPELYRRGRSGWHIHILLYTSDCVHKLYTLGCCLGIMSGYLYAFCFHCVYNAIRVSERMRGRTREFSENGRLGAYILCILSYTCFIMIVYIMLYIYGLYGARKGVCMRLCILRHTPLYAVGLSCV